MAEKSVRDIADGLNMRFDGAVLDEAQLRTTREITEYWAARETDPVWTQRIDTIVAQLGHSSTLGF